MRNAFVETLCDLAEKQEDIFLLTGDLGFGVLTKFWENFPDRFINAGIAEQNMTTVAAGLAMEKKCVFTYSIANFPTMRCLEQIRNDVAYHNVNVNIVAVGGGFSYGALGMSHHATEDVGIMRVIPNMVVFTPNDPLEAQYVTKWASEIPQPCYIRLGKGKESFIHQAGDKIQFNVASKLRIGKDVIFMVAGSIVEEVLQAADELKEYDIECGIYAFSSVKPIDKNTIFEAANQTNYIITVEEHSIIGGLGSAVAEVLAEDKHNARLIRLGLNNEFSCVVGSQSYLREFYGISSNKIKAVILSLLKHE